MACVAAVVMVLPGWRAQLVPVEHDVVLEAASRSRTQTGVVRAGAAPGEEWHVQYLDSWPVRMLDEFGLRRAATALVPPDFAAHVPSGSMRADAYFRAESATHWPWWRAGGGVEWSVPR